MPPRLVDLLRALPVAGLVPLLAALATVLIAGLDLALECGSRQMGGSEAQFRGWLTR